MVSSEFDFGFAVEWMRKDLRIALEEAGSNGAMLEVTEIIDGFVKNVLHIVGDEFRVGGEDHPIHQQQQCDFLSPSPG